MLVLNLVPGCVLEAEGMMMAQSHCPPGAHTFLGKLMIH